MIYHEQNERGEEDLPPETRAAPVCAGQETEPKLPLQARGNLQSPGGGAGGTPAGGLLNDGFGILAALGQAVIVTDLNGCITFWNAAASRLYGWREEEVIGRSVLEVTVPREAGQEAAQIFGLLRAGERWSGEFPVRHKDGHEVLAFVQNSPLLDAEGRVAGMVGISVDCKQWRQSDEAVEQAAQFPAENPNPVMRVCQDGVLLYANPFSAVLRRDWQCQVGGRVPEAIRALVLEALGCNRAIERDLACGDRLFSLSLAPFPQRAYVNIYARDVTERVQASEAWRQAKNELENANAQLQTIMEAAQVAICVAHDADCRFITGNARAQEMLGMGQGQNLSATGPEPVPYCALNGGVPMSPDTLPMQRAARTGETVSGLEVEMVTPGKCAHILCSAAPLRDASGAICGAVGTFQDITELKRTEAALRNSQEQLQAALREQSRQREFFERVLHHAPVCIAVLRGPSLVFEMANPAYQASAGPGVPLLGRPYAEVFPEAARRGAVAMMRDVLVSRHAQRIRNFETPAPGKPHSWWHADILPLPGQPGETDSVLVITWETTEQVLALKQLQDYSEQLRRSESYLQEVNAGLEKRVEERTLALRQATEELNSFVHALAHDLRAPLRAHAGYGTLLMEESFEKLDAESRNYVLRMIQAGDRVSHTLQDLMSYIGMASSGVQLGPVSLMNVLEQACADLKLEKWSAKASITIEDVHGLFVLGHASTLNLALFNLLSNACKFVAPDTRPEVRVGAERRGETIRVWVQDNGIGISPREKGELFTAFKRLRAGLDYPGTGLGLANVRRAVERMGGKVGVESEPGQGSRFWIELPAAS